MTGTLRAATPHDVDELCRLRWQLYTERVPGVAETFDEYRRRFVEFATLALARDDWRAWAIEEDGRLVATMWLQTVQRVPAPGRRDPSPIGYLTNVYVEPDHRNRGVGSRMVAAAIEHCRAEGFELVITFPAEDAYAFYDRGGFTRPPDPVVHRLGPND